MGEGRLEGLHLGEIIQQMKKAAGEGYKNSITEKQLGVYAQVGFLWETAAEYMTAGLPLEEAMDVAFKRQMVHSNSLAKQVKVAKEGIHMTPDSFDAERGELISYKATWRSFKKAATQADFERNFWAWVTQEAAYAYALGVDTATWVVLWVCGDYTGAKQPIAMQARATWTAEELAENWRVVTEHAKSLDNSSLGPIL